MRTSTSILAAATGLIFTLLPLASFAAADVSANVSNVVAIACGNDDADGTFVPVEWGTGVNVGGMILMSASLGRDADGTPYRDCLGGMSDSATVAPSMAFRVSPGMPRDDVPFDYTFAFTYAIDTYEPFEIAYTYTSGNADALELGDEIRLLGYPDVGGTVVIASGTVSDFDGDSLIEVDTGYGNSDGIAFDLNGNGIGIFAASEAGGNGTAVIVQNRNAIYENAFGGASFRRDYATLHTGANVYCEYEFCFNRSMADGDIPEQADGVTVASVATPPSAGTYEPSEFDGSLQDRMLGRILLQVESHGEAWYVSPADKLRYYMPDGASAYRMMREMSLGITNADLAGISSVADADAMLTASSVCATNALASQLRGKILLQVESHGEAWYVHPDTCRRVYMADGDAAYSIMRLLSLGISDVNLRKMPSSI